MLSTARRLNILLLALALAPALHAAPQNRPANSAAAPARVTFQPRFTPGQVMRYHLSLESNSTTRQSGMVHDEQGPSQLDVTWDATVRLEVSAASNTGALPASRAAGSVSPVRLRITYESSEAGVRSDTPEPRSDEIQQQYSQLAGRSLEFTMAADGRVSEIHGLEGLVDDAKTRDALQQWIVQLSAASGTPAGGVIPGQKWSATRAADLPLAGLSWRTDGAYLRNAPCRLAGASDASSVAASPSERKDCAVIQSRLTLVTTRALRDPTPDDYRRNGMRTSGHWVGVGEGLMYVSLDTGWVISSTQESTQNMDVTIAAALADKAGFVRQAGAVTTRLQVLLLKQDDAVPAAPTAPPAPSSPAASPAAPSR